MKIRYLLAIDERCFAGPRPRKRLLDLASDDFVRISPFRRSANVDGVDWLSPASGS